MEDLENIFDEIDEFYDETIIPEKNEQEKKISRAINDKKNEIVDTFDKSEDFNILKEFIIDLIDRNNKKRFIEKKYKELKDESVEIFDGLLQHRKRIQESNGDNEVILQILAEVYDDLIEEDINTQLDEHFDELYKACIKMSKEVGYIKKFNIQQKNKFQMLQKKYINIFDISEKLFYGIYDSNGELDLDMLHGTLRIICGNKNNPSKQKSKMNAFLGKNTILPMITQMRNLNLIESQKNKN